VKATTVPTRRYSASISALVGLVWILNVPIVTYFARLGFFGAIA